MCCGWPAHQIILSKSWSILAANPLGAYLTLPIFTGFNSAWTATRPNYGRGASSRCTPRRASIWRQLTRAAECMTPGHGRGHSLGIVRFALKYPHTFYVVAALILFLGVTAAVEMPTDIFPEINIPVVSVICQYTGLDTTEMEQRGTTYTQYAISSNVNGIRNIEAETVNGISVQKLYFQPDVNLDLAISQVVAATNAIRALLPTGTQPPIVVQYSASAVPVMQISLSSDRLSESQLYDYGIYRLREKIRAVPGVTLPTPAGGKDRQIMVDIAPPKLLAK